MKKCPSQWTQFVGALSYTPKRLWIQFLVEALAWVVGLVTIRACIGGSQLLFLSLSLDLKKWRMCFHTKKWNKIQFLKISFLKYLFIITLNDYCLILEDARLYLVHPCLLLKYPNILQGTAVLQTILCKGIGLTYIEITYWVNKALLQWHCLYPPR